MRRFEDALAALGLSDDAVLLDGCIAPERAAKALARAPRTAVLRALESREGPGEELPDLAGGARFGPWPPKQWFVAFEKGAIRAVSLREDAVQKFLVRSISIVSLPTDWRTEASAPFTATIEVGVEGDRALLVGLSVAEEEGVARARLALLAEAIATITGIDLPYGTKPPDDAVDEPDITKTLSRVSFGREADCIVLRDHGGPDPKRNVPSFRAAAIAFAVIAVGLYVTLALEIPRVGIGAILGTGSLALVSSVAAYAFFEIARFGARYDADSVALAWFGADRVVVAPWVSRRGAIDTRPSGRFGAAIRTTEIHGCSSLEKNGEAAVELSTEHGPIEVVRLADREAGVALANAIERMIASVAAPEKKKTALMRAKARRADAAG